MDCLFPTILYMAATAQGRSRTALLTILFLTLLVPMVVISLSPLHANTSLWYLGMLPVIIGLFAGPRLGFTAAVVNTFGIGVSLLLHGQPVAGPLFMALFGVATGIAARIGWHQMMSFAGPLAAFALIGDLQVALPVGTVPASSSAEAIFVSAGIVLVSGLWTASIGSLIVARVPMRAPRTWPKSTSQYFAVALGLLTGIGSYLAIRWLDPQSWWMILTFYVVVQPLFRDTVKRLSARVLGTLAGALAAVVVVELLGHLPGVIAILALALTVAAAYANLKAPYWAFVAVLTPAVVLQTSGGTGSILAAIYERALYTLIGAVAAIIVIAIGHLVVKRGHPGEELDPDTVAAPAGQ